MAGPPNAVAPRRRNAQKSAAGRGRGGSRTSGCSPLGTCIYREYRRLLSGPRHGPVDTRTRFAFPMEAIASLPWVRFGSRSGLTISEPAPILLPDIGDEARPAPRDDREPPRQGASRATLLSRPFGR